MSAFPRTVRRWVVAAALLSPFGVAVPRDSAFAAPPTQASAGATGATSANLTLDDLTTGELVRLSSYSLTQAADLSLPFTRVHDKLNRKILAYEWLKWVGRPGANGRMEHVGVAVQLVLDITVLDAQANLSGLPFIAASATFGYVTVNAMIRTVGLSSPDITQALPQPGNFDVANYAQWFDAAKRVKELVSEPGTKVAPTRLPEPQSEPAEADKWDDMIAQIYALTHIADRHTLSEALEKLPSAKQGSIQHKAVGAVYLDFAKITTPDVKPSSDAAKNAKARLNDLLKRD